MKIENISEIKTLLDQLEEIVHEIKRKEHQTKEAEEKAKINTHSIIPPYHLTYDVITKAHRMQLDKFNAKRKDILSKIKEID